MEKKKTVIGRSCFTGLITLLIFTAALLAASPGQCGMTPEEILRESDRARGNVEGIEWVIDIDSLEKGRKQHRTLLVMARDFNSLAEFLSPSRVKGRKILMVDRNMWFVKPGLKKPVPISPRQKLLGGASNGDIASTNYAGDYHITRASEEVVEGEPCHLFDLSASNKKATYDRIKYWISRERLVGVKADFFTVSGRIFKSAAFEYGNRIRGQGKDNPFVSRMVITNAVMKEDVTAMIYRDVKVRRIPDSTFNLNLLLR